MSATLQTLNMAQPPENPPLDSRVLLRQLSELRLEHHDLHEAIARMAAHPCGDDLVMRRMKKRKLLLKDRIEARERTLLPNEPA